jgi:hypothetical protein
VVWRLARDLGGLYFLKNGSHFPSSLYVKQLGILMSNIVNVTKNVGNK